MCQRHILSQNLGPQCNADRHAYDMGFSSYALALGRSVKLRQFEGGGGTALRKDFGSDNVYGRDGFRRHICSIILLVLHETTALITCCRALCLPMSFWEVIQSPYLLFNERSGFKLRISSFDPLKHFLKELNQHSLEQNGPKNSHV